MLSSVYLADLWASALMSADPTAKLGFSICDGDHGTNVAGQMKSYSKQRPCYHRTNATSSDLFTSFLTNSEHCWTGPWVPKRLEYLPCWRSWLEYQSWSLLKVLVGISVLVSVEGPGWNICPGLCWRSWLEYISPVKSPSYIYKYIYIYDIYHTNESLANFKT